MNKKILFITIFILTLPFSFAEIDILQDKPNYLMGEKINIDVSVTPDEDIEYASLELTLSCDSYEKKYFIVSDLTLSKDITQEIEVSPLTVREAMLGDCEGECRISCEVEAFLRDENDEKAGYALTENFVLENYLEIECSEADAKPGEEVNIICTARVPSGDLVSEGSAEIGYRKIKIEAPIEAGMLSFTIPIYEDTPTGVQRGDVHAKDDMGNYGETLFEIEVEGIPTTLENEINKDSFMPGETIEVRPLLYDHAGDIIDASILLEIVDFKGDNIKTEEVLSAKKASYVLDPMAEPGEYKIKSSAEGLTGENSVIVEAYKKVELVYLEEKVYAKNVGNVRYDDTVTVILKKLDKEYLIDKKLKLEPGEEEEIDLTLEVPYGYYDVILPKDSVSEGSEDVFSNVEIHDNRPLSKKVGSGFGLVTGAVASSVEAASKRPIITGLIISLLVIGIVLFYSKDFILGKVKFDVNKKEGIHVGIKDYDDEVKDLFNDYEFNSKK